MGPDSFRFFFAVVFLLAACESTPKRENIHVPPPPKPTVADRAWLKSVFPNLKLVAGLDRSPKPGGLYRLDPEQRRSDPKTLVIDGKGGPCSSYKFFKGEGLTVTTHGIFREPLDFATAKDQFQLKIAKGYWMHDPALGTFIPAGIWTFDCENMGQKVRLWWQMKDQKFVGVLALSVGKMRHNYPFQRGFFALERVDPERPGTAPHYPKAVAMMLELPIAMRPWSISEIESSVKHKRNGQMAAYQNSQRKKRALIQQESERKRRAQVETPRLRAQVAASEVSWKALMAKKSYVKAKAEGEKALNAVLQILRLKHGSENKYYSRDKYLWQLRIGQADVEMAVFSVYGNGKVRGGSGKESALLEKSRQADNRAAACRYDADLRRDFKVLAKRYADLHASITARPAPTPTVVRQGSGSSGPSAADAALHRMRNDQAREANRRNSAARLGIPTKPR